ncbi:MAG: hypothetical protein ACRD01_05060 [Terriglobales bacterium]
MILLPPDFKEFLRSLNSAEAEILVSGGYTVSDYGYAPATADRDIGIEASARNAGRVARVLTEFGFPDPGGGVLTAPGQVLRMGVPPVRLELLTSISGCEFADCDARREATVWDGIPVALLALDELTGAGPCPCSLRRSQRRARTRRAAPAWARRAQGGASSLSPDVGPR